MRLPHITVEYKDDEVAGVGKISPSLILGFGFHWTWVFLTIFSSNIIFSFSTDGATETFIISSMLVMSLTLLSYMAFFARVRTWFKTSFARQRIRVCAASLASLGTCICALCAGIDNGFLCIVLLLFAGILTGIGSAALLMSYGVSFSVCDTAAAAMQFALSCVVTAISFPIILVLDTNIAAFGAICAVVLPWVEVLCLWLCSRQLVDKTEFIDTMMPVKAGKFTFLLGPSAFAFGLLFGFLGIHTFNDIATFCSDATTFLQAVFIAGILVCALVICIMLTQRQLANYAFRTLIPIIAIFLALAAYLLLGGTSVVTHCLLLASYMLVEACVWISFSDMSQKFRISPFQVYGTGRGFVALGAVTATTLMLLPNSFAAFFNSTDSILYVALVLLVLAPSAYPRDAQIIRVLVRGKLCPAFFNPYDQNNGPARAVAKAEASAPEKAAASNVESIVSANEQPEQAADAVNAVSNAKQAPAAEIPSVAKQPEQAKANNIQSAINNSAASTQAQNETEAQHLGRYKRRCLALANMCLLSRRETEVLFLLAKGYNTKRIQEQLYISAGTANTHMRHVYRKLDVHSQQDLIRMVDSMEVEDETW